MGGLPTPRPGCVVEESPEGLRVIGKDDSSIDYTDQYNKGAEEVLKMAQMFNVKKAYLLKDSYVRERLRDIGKITEEKWNSCP